jgi:hypothetical protein
MAYVTGFLDMFQTSPWGFIAILMGTLGLLMAVPPFLQMFKGKPNVVLGFEQHESDPFRVLVGTITNVPLTARKNPWL